MTTTLRSGREPFEVALLGAIALYGLVVTVAFDKVAVTTLRAFPEPFGRVFIILLALGALIAVIGVLMGNITGLLLEQVGLWWVSGLGLAFSIWSYGVNDARALGFIFLILGVAIASGVRLRQIYRQKKISTTAARLLTGDDERAG